MQFSLFFINEFLRPDPIVGPERVEVEELQRLLGYLVSLLVELRVVGAFEQKVLQAHEGLAFPIRRV